VSKKSIGKMVSALDNPGWKEILSNDRKVSYRDEYPNSSSDITPK